MTDTTAPDAINQADDIVTIDEIRAIFSSGTVPMEAAVAIQNATSPAALRAELREIAAAHRRFAAHGAGEGLREAWTAQVDALDVQALASAIHDGRYDQGQSASTWTPFSEEPHSGKVYCLRIANAVVMHLLSLTPPSDAGSTTREGGEGVIRAVTTEMRRFMPNACGEWADKIEAALATTPSPDASPDSGEAQYPDNTYTPYGRRSVHNLTELLEITEQRPTVVSVVNRAYDEIVFLRALAASPASLSGGVEEVAAELLDHYADFIRRDVKANDLERHPYLPLIEQTAADLLHPSPEAPANRQEAGEVERLREALRPLAVSVLADPDTASGWRVGYVTTFEQQKAAHLAYFGAPTTLVTLTSPKDVKGEARG